MAGAASRESSVRAATELGIVAGKQKRRAKGSGHVAQPAIVGVVPGALTGQCRVNGMVKIVCPLGVERVPSDLLRPNDAWIVEIAFRNQHEVPPHRRLQPLDL